MTEDDLTIIEQRANAAQKGPWKSMVEGRDHTAGSNFIMTGPEADRGEDIELSGATIADQDFIAHAREDVPLLIAEVRRLQQLLGKV